MRDVSVDSFILGTGKAGEISGVKETQQTSKSRPSQQETRANFFAVNVTVSPESIF